MKYISTRNGSKEFNFTEVFIKGLADDGGLFIPKTIPAISEQDLLRLSKLNYKDLAKEIIFLFCDETIIKDELSNNQLWKKYCNSLCDFSSIFIIKAIELLKENGQLIFITPEYWLNTTHSIKLRNYIIENGYFEKMS